MVYGLKASSCDPFKSLSKLDMLSWTITCASVRFWPEIMLQEQMLQEHLLQEHMFLEHE